MLLAALLEKTRKVVRYIDFLMLVVRETRDVNGYTYLKVSQQ
uniref:Guanine nucleotide-binding protein alpha-1 subunit n=1 Tax=Rhizophora mucronata TaxID=61149 RepID=A0A2P2KR63_RHIMU